MALKDEIKEQHEKLSYMTGRQRLDYMLYYYKFHIIVTFGIIAFILALVHNYISAKTPVFTCALIDSNGTFDKANELADEFASKYNIDTEKNLVTIDTEYAIAGTSDEEMYVNIGRLMALLEKRELTALIAPEKYITAYEEEDIFSDLSKVLPADEFIYFESAGRILYATSSTGESIPAAIRIEGAPITGNAGFYTYQNAPEVFIGIPVNADNKRYARDFINFITN